MKNFKKNCLTSLLFLCFFCIPSSASAQKDTLTKPYNWTFEFRTGLWIPTSSGVKQFFGTCCQFPFEAEFGWMFHKRLNITGTVGFLTKRGNAIGASSGLASGDTFRLTTFPIRLDAIYRFNFKERQFLVPFVRAGFDTVLFRESSSGTVVKGAKFGLHGAAGLGFLLSQLDDTSIESDFGVDSVYLNLEGRYAYINSFGATGMDFSGFYPYVGVLFLF